ncbi:MAG: CoB--CoM heterodisulfide reductase subunit B [Promethearchaeota archaeon]
MEDVKNQIHHLKLQPESVEQLISLGDLYLSQGNMVEARYQYLQTIEKYPSHVIGFLKMGQFSLRQRLENEANNYFTQALNLNPKSKDVLLGLAHLHYARKGFLRAEDFILRALKEYPEDPEVLFFAGIINLGKHNMFYAQKYLDQALQFKEALTYPYALFHFGILNAKLGFFERASDNFVVLEKYPPFIFTEDPQGDISKNAQILQHNRAYIYYRLGELDKAIQLYTVLLEKCPTFSASSWVNLGLIHWIRNDTAKALDCFQRANKIDFKAWPWERDLQEYLKSGSKGLAQKMAGLATESPNPDGLNVGMYLGCVIPNRYPYIDAASRHVLNAFQVGIAELEGAGCCPAPGVFRSFDIDTWYTLAARNITIAEDMNRTMAIMCNGCYGTLNDVNYEMKHDPKLRAKVNTHLKEIGKEFQGTIKTDHIAWIMYHDIGLEAIRKKIVNKLDLKVAIHYGCHILKPAYNKPWTADFEIPTFLDELVEITGCTSVPYKDKLMCCGAGGGLRGSEKIISLDFTRDKLESIRDSGADIIVDCCPFCHLQFDLGQKEINTTFSDKISNPFKIPVIYFTQLLGLAMGLDPYRLGLLTTPVPTKTPPFTPVDPLFATVLDDLDLP